MQSDFADLENQTDASPRIILELKNVQNDVCDIGEHVQRMEDQMTSMLHMMDNMCRLMISKNKQKQKPKKAAPKSELGKRPTEKDISEYLNLSEALQENILTFLEDLPLQESQVLDQMIANECLTEDDCDNIRSFNNKIDRIRTLIRTIKRRDSKTIFEFLDIIGEVCPHLKTKVYERFNDKQNQDSNDRQQMCPTCLMIKIVDLKDIADILWGKNLLPDELYDIVIVDAERFREILWNTILHYINKRSNSEQTIAILINALESKYGHIAALLKGQQDLTQLQCGCYRSNKRRRRFAYATSSTQGSATNISEANIPKLFLLDQSSSLEESAEDTEPKLEKLKESFDFSDPSKYDEISERQAIPNIVPDENEDALNQNLEASKRRRYESGDFKPSNEKESVSPIVDSRVFNRTISTVVVCEADSTTNDDELNPDNALSQRDSNEQACDSTKPTNVKEILERMDAKSSAKKACIDEYTGSDDELLENLSSSRSKKEKAFRQQFYQRQKSAPAGVTLTKSKLVSNLEANIGTRERPLRKSKRSLKRSERRKRRIDSMMEEDSVVAQPSSQAGIPYNPMWNKVPQPRNTCKWGYPEARRHNLLSNKLAIFQRRENDSKSDSEMKVGESETPNLSEYTV